MDIITYALAKKYIDKALQGAGALKGEKGDPGKSAYEIAVEAGYDGTPEDWLESIRGRDGYTPYIGDNGNWFINGIDTGATATGAVKISSTSDSSEIIIDEENCTISSIVDGEEKIVANYSLTGSIEEEKIKGLFTD